jgi:transposase
MSERAVFKAYRQHQPTFLPPSLEDLIPAGHLVRVVSRAIDEMDLQALVESYVGGGASSYHPVMLLKVMVYCYTQRIYSSRRIAKAIRENTHCMWLAGGNEPDFRTMNRFRSSRLKRTLDQVYTAMVEMLLEAGLIGLEDCFVDGTKIEANANKYTFVWKKAVEKNKTKVEKKIKDLLKHIEKVQRDEDQEYGDRDLEEVGENSTLTPEMIRERMKKLNEKLRKQGPPKDTKRSRALAKGQKTLEEDCLVRLERYEQYQKILAGRNSFSKTDLDATFMRMKDDHMRNGQLKPGYNVQLATERRYVLHVSIHQRSTDTATLKDHLEGLEHITGRSPKRYVADAGYGSLENYEYLAAKNIQAYVKYNSFDKERTRAYRKNRFDPERFAYDPTRDQFFCPANRPITFVGLNTRRSANGYRSVGRVYRAENCADCPFRQDCAPSGYNRRFEINHDLVRFKAQVRERLNSPLGVELRRRRMTEPETVFAQTKHNRGFQRFLLRGKDKVRTEYGLVALAHNLNNLANDPQKPPRFA